MKITTRPQVRPQPVRRGVALTGGLCTALVACALAVQVHARVSRQPAATASWPEERRFAGAALAPEQGARDGSFEERGAALVVADGQPAVLEAGELYPLRVPAGFAVVQVVASGRALVERTEGPGAGQLCVLRGGGAPAPLARPAGFAAEGKVTGVRLSRDGLWVAWAGSVRQGRFERSGLVLAEVDGPARRTVPLGNADALTMARLVGVDTEAERVELADAAGSSLTLDLDGQIVAQSLREPGVRRGVQVGAAGRALWTVAGAAVLEWSTTYGAGQVALPAGYAIGSVSISKDGARIAYTAWAASLDAVLVVVSAASGAEVLRRYAGHTRPAAAFLGADRLAVSPAGENGGGVVVLRVPGARGTL